MKLHETGMFGAMFAWLTDVSAFHSQPWWLPPLHPGSSTSPRFVFLGSKWLTGRHQGLNSNLVLQKAPSETHGWCHRNRRHVFLVCDVVLTWWDMLKRQVLPGQKVIKPFVLHAWSLFATGTTCWRLTFLKVSNFPTLTPLNSHTVCFFLDKVVTLLLILTKGRDCICWKLLLECPKAL